VDTDEGHEATTAAVEGADEIYAVMQRWKDAFVAGGSLTEPGTPAWTVDAAEDLFTRFVDNPDEGDGGFVEKLPSQLEGASRATVMLLADLVTLYQLGPRNIGGKAKRAVLEPVLALAPGGAPPPMAGDVTAAFEGGLFNGGMSFTSSRYWQVAFLVRAARAMSSLSESDRTRFVSDPWFCKEVLAQLPSHSAGPMRNSLLHLIHPRTFECIVSDEHRRKITRTFADLITQPTEDIDRQLAQIRAALTAEHGNSLHLFYADDLKALWDPPKDSGPWRDIVYFAAKFLESEHFDRNERDFKLRAAAVMAEAAELIIQGSAVDPEGVIRAMNARENNLVDRYTKGAFSKWLRADPEGGITALKSLWAQGSPAGIDQFSEAADGALGSTGAEGQVVSWLLFARGPKVEAPYRPSLIKRFCDIIGREAPNAESPTSERYEDALAVFDLCIDELGQRDIKLRDRLDAQSLIWALITYPTDKAPIADWTARERKRLKKLRGDATMLADLPTEPDERIRHRYAHIRSCWQDWQKTNADPAESPTDASDPLALAHAVGLALEAAAQSGDAPGLIESLRSLTGYPSHLRSGSHSIFHTKVAAAPTSRSRQVIECLKAPIDEQQATRQIQVLSEIAAEQGAVVGMTALVASGIWALQDSSIWPPLWASAEGPAARVGWLSTTDQTPSERYLAYRARLLDLDPEDPTRAATVLSWWRTNFCGIDATTPDRCRENAELASAYYEHGRQFADDQESQARSNAQAITGDLVLAGGALIPALSTVLGTELRREPTSLRYGSNQSYRTDAFVVWRDPASKSGLGPRLWVTADRVIVGLFPGRSHEGWTAESAAALLDLAPSGLEWFSAQASDGVYSLTPTGDTWAGGAWLLGRAFTYEEASQPSFQDQIIDVATELKPLIEHLSSMLAGEPTPQEEVHVDDETEGIDHLAVAAEHLLIDPAYLEELVWYLRDKKQIVLYGPPGTGKTYLARTVARALAEQDPERVEIVQFHPATSYEDFFEGIRPKVVDGTVVYAVEKGPLARLAERAMADRDHDHVLLIDELNRANLPKVLGELLFLLEYRDESISTLYREKFELPDNLLIIATMNTADRSIALVDAAMRRRFHFRPFFPADEPVASLLRSWLDDKRLDTHIADLLDGVNIELTRDLGRDLQLGPSHFMRTDIYEDGIIPKIWRANIEPFIEDHLFDQPDAIARYRWEQIHDRHMPTPPAAEPEPEDAADGT
jgi:hypothetical protein